MIYCFLETLVEAIGDWLYLLLRWLLAIAGLAAVFGGSYLGWRMLAACLLQAGCPP